MQPINNFDELLNRIDAVLEVRKHDIETATTMAAAFYFDPPEDVRSAVIAHKPGSHESYNTQMSLIYERIAGHSHKIEMEGHDSSFMDAATAFPFCLPPKDAGYWVMAYGFFLHCIALPVGSRVLEIGFGAGGLTEVLVRGGLNVTAVELRESNCETLRKRVGAFGGRVHAIQTQSIDCLDYPNTYDAIIFYEAFHHMPAPRELIIRLKSFLNPGGIFVFGAEPIQPASPLIPFPWGFRMDGGSLGAIRDVGWVEFGFQEDFFVSMLKESGYAVSRTHLPGFTHCDVWIARPI